MREKIIILPNLTLFVALALSAIAAYYSIIGLTAIFSGAIIPIVVMGIVLEVAKLVTTVWLKTYWKRCGWALKTYLVPSVVILMLITSMGIFGFLSKAHMDQGVPTSEIAAKVAIIDEKIKIEKDNIDASKQTIKQLDAQVDQVLARSDTENGAARSAALRRSQQKERAGILADIQSAQVRAGKLTEEKAPISSQLRKVEAEVGPIKYIAALIYGDSPDQNLLEKAVRWMIILLVVVFDPLALALILAANQSKAWERKTETEETPAYEADDGPVNEQALEALREQVKEDLPIEELITKSELFPSDSTINCYKCGTELINAPGIGPFCPNKECDVVDGPFTEEDEPIKIDTTAYLKQPFVHFTNTKPMVAPAADITDISNTADVTITTDVADIPKEDPVDTSPDMERPGDYLTVPPSVEIITHGVTIEVVPSHPEYVDLPGGYVSYQGKHMNRNVLKDMRPDLFRDSTARVVSSSFGIKFPAKAVRGDVFVRVDVLPNKVYKFDGQSWMVINKNQTDTYLQDLEYIKYLVAKIDSGEYDIEMLTDHEKQQIEEYLK